MGKVLAAAKEHDFTEANLHVLAANDLARKFYEDLGWEVDLDVKIKGSGEETAPKVRYRKNQL